MDMKDFDSVCDEVLQCLTENEENDPDIDIAYSWFKKIFEYNIPYGKKIRGLTVLKTFESLATPEQLTEENIHLCKILGWCVEAFATFVVVTDDIVDQSDTRRGKLCWYKKEEVGRQAYIDVITLENATFVILRKYFRNKPYYTAMIELFVEVTKHLVTGQFLDSMTSSMNGPVDFSLFTLSRYEVIAIEKTGSYTSYLAVVTGMYFSGISDEQIIEQLKPILFKMGVYIQAENDYVDVYLSCDKTGKEGNDIQEGKFSWLILTALKLATDDQRNELMNNYGKPNKESVAKVRAIFDELDMPSQFKIYAKEFNNEIEKLIKDLPEIISPDIFYGILKAYTRVKL